MSWYNEPRRHSLASKGIKTAIDEKPVFIKEPYGLPRELQPTGKYQSLEYQNCRRKWDGKTDSGSPYSYARGLGASHEDAVIYAVTGEMPAINKNKEKMPIPNYKNPVYFKGEYWDVVNYEDGTYTLDNGKGKTAYAYKNEIEQHYSDYETPTDELKRNNEPSSGKISLKKKWVRTDDWRGYEEPINAFAGYNDTGNWEDSPYPSNEGYKRAVEFKKFLKEKKIPFKTTTGKTSNIFAVNHFFVTTPEKVEEAKKLTDEFIRKTKNDRIWVN